MEEEGSLVAEMSTLFKMLGDKNRLKILLLLDKYQELNVSSLAENLKMEQSAVSHQLRLLRSNHLVQSRRDGQMIYYTLDDKHVAHLLKITKEHLQHSL